MRSSYARLRPSSAAAASIVSFREHSCPVSRVTQAQGDDITPIGVKMVHRVAAATLLLLASAAPASATWPPNGGPNAAAALAARVLGPGATTLFEFTELAPGACDAERGPCATINTGSKSGTVAIAGSTPVEMAYALAQCGNC